MEFFATKNHNAQHSARERLSHTFFERRQRVRRSLERKQRARAAEVRLGRIRPHFRRHIGIGQRLVRPPLVKVGEAAIAQQRRVGRGGQSERARVALDRARVAAAGKVCVALASRGLGADNRARVSSSADPSCRVVDVGVVAAVMRFAKQRFGRLERGERGRLGSGRGSGSGSGRLCVGDGIESSAQQCFRGG